MTGDDKRGTPSESPDKPDMTSAGDTDEKNLLRETMEYAPSSGSLDSGSSRSSGGDRGQVAETPTRLGRYEVRGMLGRGGFGAVYVGFDLKLDRQVAIKVPHLRDDIDDIEDAFLEETRRLAQLHHHGIVAIRDVGVEDGRCYIVSDYLEGTGLDVWLKENKPTWRQAASIVAAIADALAHAHAQSTIHRDVKPENVILIDEADGLAPKLVEFGLAISESHATGEQRGFATTRRSAPPTRPRHSGATGRHLLEGDVQERGRPLPNGRRPGGRVAAGHGRVRGIRFNRFRQSPCRAT